MKKKLESLCTVAVPRLVRCSSFMEVDGYSLAVLSMIVACIGAHITPNAMPTYMPLRNESHIFSLLPESHQPRRPQIKGNMPNIKAAPIKGATTTQRPLTTLTTAAIKHPTRDPE